MTEPQKIYNPPFAWGFLNNPEVDDDGVMRYMIHEYDERGLYKGPVTGPDLSWEVCNEVVNSRNEALGYEQNDRGFWFDPRVEEEWTVKYA